MRFCQLKKELAAMYHGAITAKEAHGVSYATDNATTKAARLTDNNAKNARNLASHADRFIVLASMTHT